MSGSRAFRYGAQVLTAAIAAALAITAVAEPPERRVFAVARASGEIRVDGVLDEPDWSRAAVIQVAFDVNPGNNTPAPVRTDARILHDDTHLYVGIHAFDDEPAKIRARYTDRDGAFQDDFAGVVLDTFDDARRGYEFFVNPLGVQMDLIQDDVSQNEDSSWDAIWASAGRLSGDGYVVELAIPLTQLRFPAAAGVQTWGLDVIRVYPRGRRYILRSQPQDRDLDCYLCQVSRLTGLDGLQPGRNLEVVPTLTSVANQSRAELGLPMGRTHNEVEPGMSARWGLTPNMTLSAAVNPDFSHVEADAAQLDVNTQFALFYEERRPFFLESADIFSTPITAVYTRTVADPAAGVKLTGKQGRTTFGLYLARDEATNLLLPGAERSSLTSLDATNDTGALRLRRDIGSNSSIGALITARSSDGYRNAVTGFDGLFRLTATDTITFQVLASSTEYPSAIRSELDQPAGTLGDGAFWAEYRHSSRHWFWRASLASFGEEFRADSGFVNQVDYRRALAGIERIWWGEKDAFLSRFQIGADWDRTETQSGELLENEVEAWIQGQGPMQSSFNINAGARERVFRGVSFDQWFVNLSSTIRPSGSIWLGVWANVGQTVDVANVRNADRIRVEPEVSWQAGQHLRLSLSHAFERLDVPGGRLFAANLTQLRAVYQLNLRTYVRLVAQLTDIDRDPGLYVDAADANTRRWFNQLLFSYKLNPQTVVFVGYSDSHRGFEGRDARADLTQESRTIFVKLGYAWLL